MSAVEKVMLFQRCVITVLQPLLDGIASGFRLRDPFGDWQTVRPLLYAWVCDYPESGKISCTLSHGSRMPCSICYAAKEHLSAVKARNTPRTPEQQQWIVNEAAGTTTSQDNPCKAYSTYPVECVLWKWDVPGTAWGNPYLVVMPDIMHQADLGIMSHIVAVVRKMKKRRVKQMDRRLSFIRDRTRLNHMRLPESAYFETGACVAAYEHRAVMQVMVFVFAGLLRQPQMDAVRAYLGWLVEHLQAAFPKQPSSWCLVKTHLMSHYVDSIRRAGHVTEFSTNMFEHLHGPLVKRIYRRSNKRNVDGQIMKFHARRIPDVVPVDDPAGRDTAMRQWAKQHPRAQAALKDALMRYAGCVTKIRAHASLAIPAADDASFSRVSHFVRATPDYFERPWYSDVAVEGVSTAGSTNSTFVNQPILPPTTMLTKGMQKETGGIFTAAPVPLFVYGAGQEVAGCGVQLAFQANFTFSLSPQSGRVGNNGFAFVVSATDRVGSGSRVGYGGMDSRSMAVEFDTTQDKKHGDMSTPHVGLNIQGQDQSIAAVKSPFELSNRKAYTAWVDYEPGEPGTIQVFLAATEVKPVQPLLERRLALCEVLQAGAEQRAFFFGFVASTTVKPFQMHLILKSAVHTAFGLTLSVESYAPVGASPFMRYMSVDYQVSANQQSAWQVSASHSWDSMPFLGWPVKNQNDCSASWAYAVVASLEAAYGIALSSEAPRLSVDSLFAAMGLTSLTAKCMAGGSPAAAFEKLLTLPSGGLTTDSKPVGESFEHETNGFERTRFKGYVGLMLAVQRQPVVVHIEASAATFVQYDGTFKYQDPDCYTGNLDHAVLVVGYLLFTNNGRQSTTSPPFWIIRNSWGVEWGDRGHMRMDIQGGDGVCGINVLPGIYPIVKSEASEISCILSEFTQRAETPYHF
ncbi:unnamed protein product [Closterium sp. Yama58-4]|nr:unnamed protein product [Closterium sp. Yama58-4]